MRRHAAWLAAAILAAGAAPARAATFDVTKPDDGADGRCDADCSLREAVIAANQTPGPDTITLHGQSYLLSIADVVDPLDPEADTPKRGDLDLTDDVTLQGAGTNSSIIDGGTIDRVLDVAPGASAHLSALAVRNGRVGPTRSGAGIRNAGTLTLTGVAISGNESRGNGGGILNTGALTMADSVVADNVAVVTGGIANRGTASLTGVTLSGNRGAEGAAALDNRGTATVTNTTVSGSHTTVEGTAVASSSGRMTLRNVTLGANADGAGNLLGAFFDGEVTVVNTIVDGPCDGSVTSLGHNVEHGNTCGLASAGDVIDTDPLLEPLADNGGPTPTRAPATGSPAVDAGDDASCPATDQRGVARPQGAHCDAGAVERGGPGGTTVTQALVELVDEVVAASRLSPAAKALLVGRLRAAIAAFDPSDPAQRRLACVTLSAFTVIVRATVPAAQASEWIAAAQRISGQLGCR